MKRYITLAFALPAAWRTAWVEAKAGFGVADGAAGFGLGTLATVPAGSASGRSASVGRLWAMFIGLAIRPRPRKNSWTRKSRRTAWVSKMMLEAVLVVKIARAPLTVPSSPVPTVRPAVSARMSGEMQAAPANWSSRRKALAGSSAGVFGS